MTVIFSEKIHNKISARELQSKQKTHFVKACVTYLGNWDIPLCARFKISKFVRFLNSIGKTEILLITAESSRRVVIWQIPSIVVNPLSFIKSFCRAILLRMFFGNSQIWFCDRDKQIKLLIWAKLLGIYKKC